MRNFTLFDNHNKNNKVLVGEYGVARDNGNDVLWENHRARPWWIASVAEAIFYLGVERNPDRVYGVAYAPLLQNVNSYQWAVRETRIFISSTYKQGANSVILAEPHQLQRQHVRYHQVYKLPRPQTLLAESGNQDPIRQLHQRRLWARLLGCRHKRRHWDIRLEGRCV